MAQLNPKATAFVPSASVTPLVCAATPLVSATSPLGASSGLSPVSQQVLDSELEALGRREVRHERRQSEQQQQRLGHGMTTMVQQPMYMYQLQTFEEIQQCQQLQAQYKAEYQQQYQPYEQTWIPSQYPIPAQQRQTYQEIRRSANQSFVGNRPEPQPRNQNYVDIQHPQQTYASPAQRAQPLRQFWDGGMETTIYPPPPQPSQAPQPGAQPPSMTRKQMRQMEGVVPANEMGMQMMPAITQKKWFRSATQITHING